MTSKTRRPYNVPRYELRGEETPVLNMSVHFERTVELPFCELLHTPVGVDAVVARVVAFVVVVVVTVVLMVVLVKDVLLLGCSH